jgi:hypothetical protein
MTFEGRRTVIMAKKKFDGVVEAVRYTQDGKLELARVYERRGPTFSDRLLLTRDELIQRLKAKKVYFVGQRLPYLASTFDVDQQVRLSGTDGKEILVAGGNSSDRDQLQGAPLF